MTRMRILAVNWLDIENPKAGGAEIHFFEIFKRLVAYGCEVSLVTSGWSGAAPEAVIDGIRVFRFGGRHSFTGLARRAVRRILEAGSYDVLVEDINKLPLYLTQLTDLPAYVIIPHLFGTTAFREAALPVAALVWLAENPIPWVYRGAAFHVISESTRDDLVRRGIAWNGIRVIHPGVDSEHYCPSPDVQRTRQPTFLYVGRLKRYKGVDTAITAFQRIQEDTPGARLLIAGTGEDRPRLERLAGRLGLDASVEFLGFVSEEKKLELLRRAWALVFPSLKEGWGMTNVEAAACCTPAIAADSPGLRDSVIDGETGILVPPGDDGAFATAMRRLVVNPVLVEQLGRQGRTFAQGLTWDDAAQRTRDHIEETILAAGEGRRTNS